MAQRNEPKDTPQFVTVSEVAGLMRVSKMTVYRMIHSGELPALRLGKSFRIPETAVHKLLQNSVNQWDSGNDSAANA